MATRSEPAGWPLLERDGELARVRAALVEARAGRGALVMIEGPAGIGKTRLLDAARERAGRAGARVLLARCDEMERAVPFGAVEQLFGPALAALGEAERRRALSGAAGLAARLLEGADLGPDPRPAALHGLYWLAAALARDGPLVIAVDDAQWADAPSLRFVGHLHRRAEHLPVAILLTVRAGEPGGDDPSIARLAADPRASVLRPRALSAAATARLLEAALGAAPARELVAACGDLAGGNPFLLRELVRAVVDGGPGAAGAERVRGLVPGGVGRAVALRLARLPPVAAELARAVAVLGGEVEPRLAASLARLPEGVARDAADRLRAADILADRRTLSFAHPLVREAVAGGLPRGERAARHLQAARLLRREPAPDEVVAAHLLEADPGGRRWVVDVLRAAAERARRRGAPESAASWLRRALAEPPPAGVRGEVLLALGEAEAQAGEGDAVGHLRAALAHGPDPVRGRAALALGRTLGYLGRLADAVSAFEQALPAAPDAAAGQALEGAIVGAGMLDAATARRVAARGRRLAEHVRAGGGAPPSVLGVLAMRAVLVNAPATEAAGLAERALGLAPGAAREAPWRAALDAGRFGSAALHAAAALAFAERTDTARRFLDDAVDHAVRTGAVQAFSAAACLRALVALRAGELDDAEADARMSVDAAVAHSLPLFLPFALGVLVEALAERGDLAEARAALEAADRAPADATSLHGAILLHARGRLRLAERQPEEARSDLLSAGRRLAALGALGAAVVPWRSGAAEALLALGEAGEARLLAAEDVRRARAFGAPRALGGALRVSGLAEGGEAGAGLLREAAAVLEASADPLARAAALVDLGAALRRAGRRADSRAPLAEGLEAAHRAGARPLAERARTELRATGARPRRAVLRGREALTASELRVASMAAEGLANREIAQRLFVTSRTVETHLSHAYAKLGVSSRAQLPAALAGPVAHRRTTA